MALTIPAPDEATLVLAITKALANAQLFSPSYNVYGMDRKWEADLIKILDPKFVKALYKNLDDGGLGSFIKDFLARKVISSDPNIEKGKPTLISSLNGFESTLKIAENIVDYMKSLPRNYAISARFSKAISTKFPQKEFRFSISDRLEIVSSDVFTNEIPLANPHAATDKWIWRRDSEENIVSPSDDNLYFIYRTSGLLSDRFDSKLFRDFSDDIRAFYGACFAFNILYHYGDDSSGEVLPRALAVEIENSTKILWHMQPLDTDLIRATYVETSIDFDRKLNEGGSAEDELQLIADLFRSPDCARLKTAAVWLLRANLSDRAMDKVLESTIALEVLLGDREASDRIGLSKLMANRCAYSLGRSAVERRELNEFFTSFYRVRSDIVHSGTFKVSENDKAIVAKGISLAHRVLKHEVVINA